MGPGGSRLTSGTAGGWPRHGSSGVDQGDLEPSRYKFMALWTVYDMACFFMSFDGYVPVNMQHKFQHSVQMTVVCLAFSSSTELDIAVLPE